MSLRLHGGGVSAGAITYGPTLGAQWVRDNAAPQAVTQPGGSIVTVNPGDLSQTVLTNNPGATFWITKGLHTITASLTPTAGQKFYLESSSGTRDTSNTAVLDAEGSNLDIGYIFGGVADAVEIHGGLFRNLGTQETSQANAYRAAIFNGQYITTEPGTWIVEDAEIGPNGQQGLRFACDDFVARRCYIHDCGYYGINTERNTALWGRLTGGLMEYCHLEANSKNIHGVANDAGQKFVHCDSSTFRNNWVEDQEGAGLWWDFQHKDHSIHDNVIERCWDWGLFYEYSYGGTEIHHNALLNNAEHYGEDSWFNAVQLLVSSTDATLGSPSFGEVRVHHNLLVGTGKQMGVVEVLGRPHPKGCKFYDNDVTWTGTLATNEIAGGESNESQDVYNPANGNTFEGNRYHVTDQDVARWQWIAASGAAGATKTWEQWIAYGHDVPDGLFEEI